MKDGKSLFHKRILERGEDYYEEGFVSEVSKSDSGYHAFVDGSDMYEVEIKLDGDRIFDMSCDCPFADGGKYCKHMAAVLYYIDNENMHDEEKMPEPTWMERVALQNKELEEVIAGIPETELRQFVKQIAHGNSEIRNLIMTTYSQKLDARQVKYLHQEVDDIVYRYSGRYRFVDYANAWNFTSDLETFLYEEEKKKLFTWFQEHSTGGYVIDFMEDYISDFLMNEFHDKELLQKKLDLIDADITRMKNQTDSGSAWSVRYGYQNNVLKRLELMKDLECSEEEIKKYRRNNWQFSAVRKLEIADLMEKGEVKQAIAVLKESKELDRQYAGLVSEYSRQLIEIYKTELMQSERRIVVICIFIYVYRYYLCIRFKGDMQ